ncbi:D-lactaldehyde dehydrogenase [Vararia minispora EC-137]|uniref:D-lactaldehyde dehydrogenase n=1 Tax=Vararia minispora EC-137 TaxID=1314806 RepID=A0ACB8QDH6_9AGAM|nr:D-lactaldehyde dehydrogenase [Vararia minispora EC-137]
MPAVPPPAKVLVTGANGYIAAWVVRALLEDGYAVRGAVRSESKGAHLTKIFAEYGDRFEIAVVEDMTKPGAFDEAVKGVELVEHTASPFHFNFTHPDELIIPARQGTLRILESIKAHAPTVKRVVLLSSCAAVLQQATEPVTYDESSWNEPAIAEAAAKGADASKIVAYRASKTLAEKAAWAFVEENKGEIGWDLVVINPPFPPIHAVPDIAALNQSMVDMHAVIFGKKPADFLTGPGNAWIDVRDLARAHVLAAQNEEAGGGRVVVSAGSHFWQELMDTASSLDPSLPKGSAGATQGRPYILKYDTSKMTRVLGLQPRGMRECVADCLEYFKGLEGAWEVGNGKA